MVDCPSSFTQWAQGAIVGKVWVDLRHPVLALLIAQLFSQQFSMQARLTAELADLRGSTAGFIPIDPQHPPYPRSIGGILRIAVSRA
jgi:hypothetical protein